MSELTDWQCALIVAACVVLAFAVGILTLKRGGMWLCLLFLPLILRADGECVLAAVEWKDAVVYFKKHGDIDLENADKLVSEVKSVGCVAVKKGVVIVIHSLTDGKPDDLLAIPAAWAVSIKPLKFAEGEMNVPKDPASPTAPSSGSSPSRAKRRPNGLPAKALQGGGTADNRTPDANATAEKPAGGRPDHTDDHNRERIPR